jgi:tRNA nucleotidyltransferase (CCA-adding enzyme)
MHRDSMRQTVELRPPREVVWIAQRLEDAGHSTWTVGGAVRDALAGLNPQDWDLTTSARPGEVQRLFKRTIPVGVEHGTVGVLGRDRRMYEVTTFRRDVETFGRKARVSFSETLEEDLERRDFTINAVAWHPVTHELRDPHGGARDLADGLLRTVGDPRQRFAEDYLRVLRALRFAGRFALRIDPPTWEAARAAADRLHGLSAERVREELFKVLALPVPSASLALYRQAGVLRELYPELEACVGLPTEGPGVDLWTHLQRACDMARRSRPLVRLAALLHDIGKAAAGDGAGHAAAGAARARELLRRLKCSNAEIDRVTHLVAQHAELPAASTPAAEVRRWIRRVGPEFLHDLLRLRAADARAREADRAECEALLALRGRVAQLQAERPPLAISDLAIGGAELRALGIPAGPLYGEILRDLLERVTDDPSLNRRDALLELVRRELTQG